MTKSQTINQNYVEYIQGSLPIILSAPHGGVLKPRHIQSRSQGVFDRDTNSAELTRAIINEFFEQTNQQPHAIIFNLCRTKVDANRALYEATSSCPHAIHSYHTFHDHIQKARNSVERKFQKGLYIDIHGQSHKHGHIEFGYLLHNNILKLEDKELQNFQAFSSIKSLSEFSQHDFIEQIKGDQSLSGFMHEHGFDAIPSKNMPYAPCGNYFEGAFNTQHYSSHHGSPISAIQAEFPYKGCRDTKKNREKTAKAFVHALLKFMHVHFDLQF